MKGNFRSLLLASALSLTLPLVAQATTINFDFTTLGTGNLGHTQTVNNVVASAFSYDVNAKAYTDADLWGRNVAHDHGLGVCNSMETATNCASGGGDVNEISNQLYQQYGIYDFLLLDNQNGGRWSSLWVSSLDNGGTNNAESGVVYWSSDGSLSDLRSFTFSYGDFSTLDEGDLFNLAAFNSVFDPTAKYLAFVPNNNNCTESAGCNNDYLVYKGSVSVPEPSALALMGLSLLGLIAAFRRRRAS